jgi:hypothetical protein
MKRITRRSAIAKTAALSVLAAPAALLASVDAAPVTTPNSDENSTGETRPQFARNFHGAEKLSQTFSVFCPLDSQWEEMRDTDPFLRSFNTVRFSIGIFAYRTMNTQKCLRKFGFPNLDDDPRGEAYTKRMEGIRDQWDFLESSPIAARFPER